MPPSGGQIPEALFWLTGVRLPAALFIATGRFADRCDADSGRTTREPRETESFWPHRCACTSYISRLHPTARDPSGSKSTPPEIKHCNDYKNHAAEHSDRRRMDDRHYYRPEQNTGGSAQCRSSRDFFGDWRRVTIVQLDQRSPHSI